MQGIVPDSKEEWWAAQWLDRFKFRYNFQYQVFTGPKYIYFIDFVIYTVPLWTMLELNGGHWHSGELGVNDRKRQVEIQHVMRDVARVPMLFLWAGDMVDRPTLEASMARLMRI